MKENDRDDLKANSVTTLERSLDVLDAFSTANPELTLKEIAEISALPLPTTFRLLTTLARRNIITKNAEGQYRLGHKIIALAAIATQPADLQAKARPIIKNLRNLFGETTYLSIRVGYDRVDIEQAEGLTQIRRVITVGKSLPLFIGCPGRVLLSGLSDKDIILYLKQADLVDIRYGDKLKRADIEADIKRIRKLGYSETRHKEGAGALSAAVRGPTGDVIAALTVSTPFARYTTELRDRVIAALLGSASELSVAMGAPH